MAQVNLIWSVDSRAGVLGEQFCGSHAQILAGQLDVRIES